MFFFKQTIDWWKGVEIKFKHEQLTSFNSLS